MKCVYEIYCIFSFSQNSLDNNDIDLVAGQAGPGYDEQELTMQVYGDDQDSKMPISKLKDNDELLVEAIRDHELKHNNLNNGVKKHQNGIMSGHFYDNRGFINDHAHNILEEATEI